MKATHQSHFPRYSQGVIITFIVVAVFLTARDLVVETYINMLAMFIRVAVNLALLAIIIGTYASLSTQVITSPQGIEYRRIGMRVRARWNQITRIEKASPTALEVVFQSPVESSRGEVLSQITLQDYSNWEQGSFGKAIRQYAPHLLSNKL